MKIHGLAALADRPGLFVDHAGTAFSEKGDVVTSGGRVLGITALGDDLAAARDRAYEGVAEISFPGAWSRTDIGHRALA
jgi:phosphoribosylamine--glycine ligase